LEAENNIVGSHSGRPCPTCKVGTLQRIRRKASRSKPNAHDRFAWRSAFPLRAHWSRVGRRAGAFPARERSEQTPESRSGVFGERSELAAYGSTHMRFCLIFRSKARAKLYMMRICALHTVKRPPGFNPSRRAQNGSSRCTL